MTDTPHLTHQEVAAILQGEVLAYEREHHRHHCEACRRLAHPPRITALELTATRRKFKLEDESGYSFIVTTKHDPTFGWSAKVKFETHGMKHEAGAVARLWDAVAHFLRMLNAT